MRESKGSDHREETAGRYKVKNRTITEVLKLNMEHR
jgi:hypothetical protein